MPEKIKYTYKNEFEKIIQEAIQPKKWDPMLQSTTVGWKPDPWKRVRAKGFRPTIFGTSSQS